MILDIISRCGIYNYIFIWCIFSYIICEIIDSRNKKILFFLFNYIPLAMIIGFRDVAVGSDTVSYVHRFDEIAEIQGIDKIKYNGFEIGYRFLNFIFLYLGLDGYDVILFVAFCTCMSFGIFFYKYSENICLSTAMFIGLPFFVESFNIARQMLSVSILIWSISMLSQNKRIKAILIIIISGLIHEISFLFIIFVPFFPLNKFKVRIIIIVVGFFAILFKIKGLDSFIWLFGWTDYVNYYENFTMFVKHGHKENFGIVNIFEMCIWPIILAYSNKRLIYESIIEKKQLILFSVIAIMIYLYIVIASTEFFIIIRFKYPFYIFGCILLPYVFDAIQSKIRPYIYIATYVILYILLLRHFFIDNDYVYQDLGIINFLGL